MTTRKAMRVLAVLAAALLAGAMSCGGAGGGGGGGDGSGATNCSDLRWQPTVVDYWFDENEEVLYWTNESAQLCKHRDCNTRDCPEMVRDEAGDSKSITLSWDCAIYLGSTEYYWVQLHFEYHPPHGWALTNELIQDNLCD